MKTLHLEIDPRHAGYITPSLTRTLEQAARSMTLEEAENVLRARTPRTWWAVARTETAVVVSHIWKGREPIPCALIVERAAGARLTPASGG
jgi:hypothetical protein